MKANTKNWNKVTVKDITTYLNGNTKEVAERAKTDKKALAVFNAQKKLVDTLKAGKKVLKAEYVAVAEKVEKLLATPVAAEEKPKAQPKQKKEAAPKQESSLKTKGKTTTKKSEPEEKAEDKPEKKQTTKQEKADSKTPSWKEMFPDEFEDEGVSYKKAEDIKNIDDLRKALEAEDDLYVARWTPKEVLKGYCTNKDGSKQVDIPKAFPNDIDLQVIVYVGDRQSIFYAVSVYTEGAQCYLGKSLKQLKKLAGARQGYSVYELYRVE